MDVKRCILQYYNSMPSPWCKFLFEKKKKKKEKSSTPQNMRSADLGKLGTPHLRTNEVSWLKKSSKDLKTKFKAQAHPNKEGRIRNFNPIFMKTHLAVSGVPAVVITKELLL